MNWAKIIALLVFSTVNVWAQNPPPPQTARQALLEMFFGKSPKALERHLPPALLAELRKGGAATVSTMLAKLSSLPGEIAAQTGKIETFEAGPNILIGEEPERHRRVEVTVERDDLSGDEDEIEISVHVYEDEQPVQLPVVPRITFLMKEDEGLWRLNELTLAGHVPLSDPEYVKGFVKELRRSAGMADTSSAYGAVRTLLTAEKIYQSTYPQRGFTCAIADLGGSGTGTPDPHHAMVIDDELASGKKNGYTYAITNCTGTPATTYRITATPEDPGQPALCADQSGAMSVAADGNPAHCGSPQR